MSIKFREKLMEEATGNVKEKCDGVESRLEEEWTVAMQMWNLYLSVQFSKKLGPTTNAQNVYFNCVENLKERKKNHSIRVTTSPGK